MMRSAEDIERIAELEAERDALAAHHRAIQDELFAHQSVLGQILRGRGYKPTEQESEVLNTDMIMGELARRDAEKQAGILEKVLGTVAMPSSARSALKAEADKLRRQAEGGES